MIYGLNKPVVLYRKLDDVGFEGELNAIGKYFPITSNRTSAVCNNALVIARYSALPFYKELEDDLILNGSFMVNSFQEHRYIADMFNWYEDLIEVTPETWFRLEDVPNDMGPYVLKGETNSRKHLWDTHMFARDYNEMRRVAFRLMDDSLIGYQGIYIRKYVSLRKFFDGIRGMPITEEYRFFIFRNMVLSGGYYWSSHADDFENGPPSSDNVPAEFLARIMRLIGFKASFYVVDVARTEKGDWIVVELNDGQMSGLSENNAETLYRNLRTVIDFRWPKFSSSLPSVFAIILYAINKYDSIDDAIHGCLYEGETFGIPITLNKIAPDRVELLIRNAIEILGKVNKGELLLKDIPSVSKERWRGLVSQGRDSTWGEYVSGLEASSYLEETIWPLLSTKWGWRIA